MTGFKDSFRAEHTEHEEAGIPWPPLLTSSPPFHLPLCTSISAHTSLTNTHHPGVPQGPPRAAAHFALLRTGQVAAVLRETISKNQHKKRWEWNLWQLELNAVPGSCCPYLGCSWVSWVSRCSSCRMKSLCCLHARDSGSSRSPGEVSVLCSCWKVKETQGAKVLLPPEVPKVLGTIWNKGSKCSGVRMSTEWQKVRKSVSGAGRGREGKCKDLTGNQSINLLRV